MAKDDKVSPCADSAVVFSMADMEAWWAEHKCEFYQDWPQMEVMETFIDAYVSPFPEVASIVTRVAYSLYIDAESDRIAARAYFETYAKAKAEKRLRRDGAPAEEFCVAVTTRGVLPVGRTFPKMHHGHKVVHIVE